MEENSSSSEASSNEIEITPYSHNNNNTVNKLTKLIFTLGLSLDLASCPILKQFMMSLCYDPSHYSKINLKTVLTEAKNEYRKLEKEIKSMFASHSHKIALSADTWCNESSSYFIRVTAHWIDSDWCVRRRVVNFAFTSLSGSITEAVEAWGIKDKIFSVTVDDFCDVDVVFEEISEQARPVLDGRLLRVRCVCRDLTSCVAEILELMSERMDKMRDVFETRPVRYKDSYVALCEKYGLKPKYGMCDDAENWDSTHQMLKRFVMYKDVINEFLSTHWPDEDVITEQDWEVVAVYIGILDVFYEAFVCFSANDAPSSSGVLIHLVNIAKLFSEYRGGVTFEGKMSVVEKGFLKYFERIPDLFCLAAVMDPRIKLSGCECLLESFYQCTDNSTIDVEEEKRRIANLLREMYNLYASQFRKTHQSTSSSSSSTSGFAWSLLTRKKQKTGDLAFDELAFYLQTPHGLLEHEMEDFDIAIWWNNHEVVYPVLSNMARDLLTTPVSTLARDCAFMMDDPERKIRDKSYHLKGKKIMKMYACLRDWFNAEQGSQGVRALSDEDEEGWWEFEDDLFNAEQKSEGERSLSNDDEGGEEEEEH